jgi:hypothetical protein
MSRLHQPDWMKRKTDTFGGDPRANYADLPPDPPVTDEEIERRDEQAWWTNQYQEARRTADERR